MEIAEPSPVPMVVIAPVKVVVPAPVWEAMERFWFPPTKVLPKVILPPLEFKETAPEERAAAPVMERPSKLLQLKPSKLTVPLKELAVSPLDRVTLFWNLVLPLELVEAMPLAPITVFRKSTRPVEAMEMAAPVPEPMAVIAPIKVEVPAPVPEAMERFWFPPAKVLPKLILLPLEFKETAPEERVAAPVMETPSKLLQFNPSKLTVPLKELAVSPLRRVTSFWNLVLPLTLEEMMPPIPLTASRKSARPEDTMEIAAPVPEPMAVIAPVKVAVPAPVSNAMIRFWFPPAKVLPKVILPPLEAKETAPEERVTAPVTERPLKLLQFMPSKLTVPLKELAAVPLIRVTLF